MIAPEAADLFPNEAAVNAAWGLPSVLGSGPPDRVRLATSTI